MLLLEAIFLISALAAILAACLIINNPKNVKLNWYEKRGLERLQKLIESVGGIENAKFYTNGHPYVWVESTYEEIKKVIFFSCVGGRGIPKPASFISKINKENGYIYVVITNKPTFEWSSLQHYEEWLKSNEPYAERIANYKERQ